MKNKDLLRITLKDNDNCRVEINYDEAGDLDHLAATLLGLMCQHDELADAICTIVDAYMEDREVFKRIAENSFSSDTAGIIYS